MAGTVVGTPLSGANVGKPFYRPYTVVLREYPALPLRDHFIAQDRFSSALESQLGGVAGVVAAFEAAGMGSAPTSGHERDAALMRWSAAARNARQIGLRGLACPANAYFELVMEERLESSEEKSVREEPARKAPPAAAPVARTRSRAADKEFAPVASSGAGRPHG